MIPVETKGARAEEQRAARCAALVHVFAQLLAHLHSGAAGPWLDLNLSMPQLKMLFVIDWLGPLSMSQVAQRLGISVSAATGVIDRLVEQGLARREPDPCDRRIVRVASTSEGHALALRLRSGDTEQLARIVARFSDEELMRCIGALAVVNREMEAALGPGRPAGDDPSTEMTRQTEARS